MIYFIQRPNEDIKIGHTADYGRRYHGLRKEHGEFNLLATKPGTRYEEIALHDQFKKSRQDGEWFSPTPDLLTLVASLGKPEPQRHCAMDRTPGQVRQAELMGIIAKLSAENDRLRKEVKARSACRADTDEERALEVASLRREVATLKQRVAYANSIARRSA